MRIESEIEGERVGKLGGDKVCAPSQLQLEAEDGEGGGSDRVDGERHVARAETARQHGTLRTQRKEPRWEWGWE